MDTLVDVCFFLIWSFLMSIGLRLVLLSPYVFKMDKRKNCCVLEKKFIWQKKYKTKPLCKLSEVKDAFRKGKVFLSLHYKLCLKLKSKKDVIIFSKPIGRYADPSFFDELAIKINHFLHSKEILYEITEEKSFFSGVLIILLDLVVLFFLIS